MTSLDPTQSKISEELKGLEASLQHLKLEYERYFLGQRPGEPARERAELARRLLRPGSEPIRNTASRFALNGLKDRFQTFSRKWDRTQGEIEAGTYTRHRFRARSRTRPSSIWTSNSMGVSPNCRPNCVRCRSSACLKRSGVRPWFVFPQASLASR